MSDITRLFRIRDADGYWLIIDAETGAYEPSLDINQATVFQLPRDNWILRTLTDGEEAVDVAPDELMRALGQPTLLDLK